MPLFFAFEPLTPLNDAPPSVIEIWPSGRPTSDPEPILSCIAGNLLVDPLQTARDAAASRRPALCWPGWIESEASEDAEPLISWGASGWTKLETFCREIARLRMLEKNAPPARVHLWARADGVISDLPSSLAFLSSAPKWADAAFAQFAVLADPIGMLTREMLSHAEDHVERILAGLGAHPGTAGIVLSNVEAPASDRETTPRRTPIHRGLIPAQRLMAIIKSHVDPRKAVFLMNTELEAQLPLLSE